MSFENTMDKLFEMRLSAMARALRDQSEDRSFADMSFDERFSMLVDAEVGHAQVK